MYNVEQICYNVIEGIILGFGILKSGGYMDRILKIFKKYDIEYDKNFKLILIHKPIIVDDFIFLKYVLKDYMYKIDDIRVV